MRSAIEELLGELRDDDDPGARSALEALRSSSVRRVPRKTRRRDEPDGRGVRQVCEQRR
jgi:hypothetical protein